MGEQISVLDLARNLIRLSGFVPGQEIPIQFVGLRPGEKLAEELVGEGEATEQSMIENILRIRRMAPIDFDNLQNKVTALEAAARLNHTTWAIDRLRELVPEFHSPGELERAPVPAMPATREDLGVSRKAGSLVESGATPSL
jgi:FlaA1/EpsC-like NDP-sugar epimerase